MLKNHLRYRSSRSPLHMLQALLSKRGMNRTCHMKEVKVPLKVLNNGKKIPVMGLGTWGSSKDYVVQAVRDAIDVGYRHIDCAYVNENETEVGEGLEWHIENGIIKRKDLFITSKLWNTFHRSELVNEACVQSIENLGLEYLDLYLIHWPMAYRECCELYPVNAEGKPAFIDVDYVETWLAMEKLVEDGLVQSIGVSNFNKAQINRILRYAKIIPQVVQVECHPYLNQKKLMKFLKSKNIALTAYSPLGSPNRPCIKSEDPVLMEEPMLKVLAEKYNRTVPQILIRYQIQRGNVCIPKSVCYERLKSNIAVFNFALEPPDMVSLDELNKDLRFISFLKEMGEHPFYPFHDEF